MQLTKLEIKGFKSFADRTVINFDEGITGIVGPNGCGKSNIVDAIRWVLGEQKSKVFRSDKMENIIFNGTKERKSIQFVEVALTFNNTKNLIPTEYSQVTITRRYYRSGESEYLLNNTTCRLKDIINLFLDTGILANSYAIIELKMVDDLLNNKDNSRRTLFEEAAGISKFKIRKKETIRKIGDTDIDLDRIDDVLFEIKKQLKALEKQSEQAKKYYEIKDDYKKTSIALAKNVVNNQQKNFDVIQEHIQKENDKKITLNTLIKGKDSVIEKTKTDLINKENLLASHQKIINEHLGLIRQYEGDEKVENERQKSFSDKIENLKEQINLDKQSSKQTTVSLQGLKMEAKKIEKEVVLTLDTVEKLKKDRDDQKKFTGEDQEKLDSLNRHFSEKKDDQFQLKKEIEIKEIQLKSKLAELNKTNEDSSQHSTKLKEFKNRLLRISREKEEEQQQYKVLKSAEENINQQIKETEEKLSNVRDELTLINRKLDAKQNEFNLTKSLVDNLEDSPEAIKFLKQIPQWKDLPLLSDVISCPEEYRIAIENFMNPFMNYCVVDSQDDALKAIDLLRESGKGKAHFFILEKLRIFKNNSNSFIQIQNAKSALELVNFDEKYETLINHLLGNVYITENPGKTSGQDKFVLLDKKGEIAHRQYSISGGSIGLFEGKRIGRVKNLDKLKVIIKKLKEDQSVLNKDIAKYIDKLNRLKLSSVSPQLEKLKDELAKINEIQVSIKTQQEQFFTHLTSNHDQEEIIQQQITDLEKKLEVLKPETEKERIILKGLEKNISKNRNEVSALQKKLDAQSTAFNEQNVTFHQIQNKLNSVLQEISYKEKADEHTTNRIENNRKELRKTSDSLEDLVQKSTESRRELSRMYDEKELLNISVNEAEKEYYETRGMIDKEEKTLREIQRQREGSHHIIMEWQNKLNDTKIALNLVKEHLLAKFKVNLNEVEDKEVAKYKKNSEDELEKKVEKLRNRMDSMGPINLMAMEAFEEMKERYIFMNKQKEDLLNAKKSLLTTIGEIDEVAKKTFMEAFQQIRDNFVEVFRTLFTSEDDCDLILTDPKDPLESPIEIVAKPKGKKPLTINQLSGGEKTLTATSLLFSIYLLKPAPFCIFDEIDAPLDDANIDKFNEIIKKFSKKSQFIIVTHNKRTIANTDVIYGVTMQEQGISTVIPIDLRELA